MIKLSRFPELSIGQWHGLAFNNIAQDCYVNASGVSAYYDVDMALSHGDAGSVKRRADSYTAFVHLKICFLCWRVKS